MRFDALISGTLMSGSPRNKCRVAYQGFWTITFSTAALEQADRQPMIEGYRAMRFSPSPRKRDAEAVFGFQKLNGRY
jgi:hypothetical protein